MKLSLEQEMSLKAALLEPSEASKIWLELLNSTPFDELEGSIYRIVSAIYKNLEKEVDLPDFERLKGAYRFNWARNSKFISAIAPVIRELEAQNANYRILKGAALNLLSGSIGIRTMGDIDLLISLDELPLVTEIFHKNGFVKKYDTECVNSPINIIDMELCFVNSDNVEVDLHLAEKSYPQTLFRTMLKTAPVLCPFMGLDVKLPGYELALIHSVIHGNQAVSESDMMQSLIDCAQLLKYIDGRRLRKFNRRLETDYIVADYLETVLSNSDRELNLGRLFQYRWIKKFLYFQFLVKNWVLDNSNIYSLVKSRRVFPRELTYIRSAFNGNRLIYFLWVKFGQLRPIERLVFRINGGFLMKPIVKFEHDFDVSGFSNHGTDWIEFSNCPIQANDWRFALRSNANVGAVTMQLFSEAFKTWNWVIFVNGKLVGTSPKNPDGVYSVPLRQDSEFLEISIRSPMHVCRLCFHDISDLRVHII
jgi:hypothetical protein